MTEQPPQNPPNLAKPAPLDPQTPPPLPAYAPPPPPPYGAAPVDPYGAQQQGYGPIGKVRSTGLCILLTIVTFGVYSLFWYFQTSEEMKRHTGQGLGGVVALLLAFFIGVASPFISSSEVGDLYERQGRPKPVTALTGLWVIPGFLLLLIGPIVWFVKTNGALNEYWKSMGATA